MRFLRFTGRRSIGSAAVAFFALAISFGDLFAQSARPFAVQGSILSTLVTADQTSAPGVGGEGQLRVNLLGMRTGPSVLSIGGGGQYSAHIFTDGTLTVRGAFVEPRIAWATSNPAWFRYASLRAALLQQSSPASTSSGGYALGLGGGLVRALGNRHNLDVGGAVLYQRFDDALTPSGRTFRFAGAVSFALKVGLTVGFGGE
jgi:hypothetical protein